MMGGDGRSEAVVSSCGRWLTVRMVRWMTMVGGRIRWWAVVVGGERGCSLVVDGGRGCSMEVINKGYRSVVVGGLSVADGGWRCRSMAG